MKHFSRLLLAALLVVPLVACGDDDGTDVEDITGTIRGTVSVEGSPQSGVTVQLAGATSQSATTGSDGGYTFSNVPEGSYTVSLTGVPDGVTFSTTSQTTSITTAGQTQTVDFSGSYIRTSSISGTVTAGDGAVEGATVTLSGTEDASTTTDAQGAYSFTGLRAGDYTVEVSDLPEGTELNTTSKSVTVAAGESATVDFGGEFDSSATVVIDEVRDANGQIADIDDVSGQLNVTLAVDEGNDRVTRVSLLVDGEEVAFQSFAGGGAAEKDGPSAASFSTTLSFNTARCIDEGEAVRCEESESGQARFLNGDRDLTASLDTEGGGSSSAQTSMTLQFNNTDRLIVSHETGHELDETTTAVESVNGVRYYGGGTAIFRVRPVMYSGNTVGQITINASSINTDVVLESSTATEDPFLFVAPYEDNFGVVEDDPTNVGHSINVAEVRDADGVTLALGDFDETAVSELLLDMTAPDVSAQSVAVENDVGTAAPSAPPVDFFHTGTFTVTGAGLDAGVGLDDEPGSFQAILEGDTDNPIEAATLADLDEFGSTDPSAGGAYVVQILSFEDKLGNAVADLETDLADDGETEQFNVDKSAPEHTDPLPAENIVFKGDGTGAPMGSNVVQWMVADPTLPDGDYDGSDVDHGSVEVAIENLTEETADTADITAGFLTDDRDTDGTSGDYTLDVSAAGANLGDGSYRVAITSPDLAIEPNEGGYVFEFILDTTPPGLALTESPSSTSTSADSVQLTIGGEISDVNGIDPDASQVTVAEDPGADLVWCTDDDVLFDDPDDATPHEIDRNTVSVGEVFSEGFWVQNSGGAADPVEYNFCVTGADVALDNAGDSDPNTATERTSATITWNP